MSAVNLDLAQRAQKAAAMVARKDGLLRRMVKAMALVIEQDRLRRGPRLRLLEQCPEHMHTRGRAATYAGDRLRAIERVLRDCRIA